MLLGPGNAGTLGVTAGTLGVTAKVNSAELSHTPEKHAMPLEHGQAGRPAATTRSNRKSRAPTYAGTTLPLALRHIAPPMAAILTLPCTLFAVFPSHDRQCNPFMYAVAIPLHYQRHHMPVSA